MTDVLEVSPVNTEEYRLLHTMIRVTDIDKSIEGLLSRPSRVEF